jgi:hypothetical protein
MEPCRLSMAGTYLTVAEIEAADLPELRDQFGEALKEAHSAVDAGDDTDLVAALNALAEAPRRLAEALPKGRSQSQPRADAPG